MKNNDYLAHYGVKGMRWGVTKAVTVNTNNIIKTVEPLLNETDKGSKVERGTYPNLTNQQMQDKINRLRLENQYSDAIGDTKYVKTGKDKAKEILKYAGAVLAIGGSIAGIVMAFDNHKQLMLQKK